MFTFEWVFAFSALQLLRAWRFAYTKKHLSYCEHKVGRDLRARRHDGLNAIMSYKIVHVHSEAVPVTVHEQSVIFRVRVRERERVRCHPWEPRACRAVAACVGGRLLGLYHATFIFLHVTAH